MNIKAATLNKSAIKKGKSKQNHLPSACDAGLSSLGLPGAPDFGRSVNPISNKGGQICPHITIGNPGFSDLPTAL